MPVTVHIKVLHIRGKAVDGYISVALDILIKWKISKQIEVNYGNHLFENLFLIYSCIFLFGLPFFSTMLILTYFWVLFTSRTYEELLLREFTNVDCWWTVNFLIMLRMSSLCGSRLCYTRIYELGVNCSTDE